MRRSIFQNTCWHIREWFPIYLMFLGLVLLFWLWESEVSAFKTRCRELGGTPVYSSHNGSQCFAKDNTRTDWEFK